MNTTRTSTSLIAASMVAAASLGTAGCTSLGVLEDTAVGGPMNEPDIQGT